MSTDELTPTTEAIEPVPVSGSAPARLIRAELIKLASVNTWWIFASCATATTALALLVNCVSTDQAIAHARLAPQLGLAPETARELALPSVLITHAADIYTSGQLFGAMFAMLLGTVLVTSEFYQQTATATFLAVPTRVPVIMAKFATALAVAAAFWLASTAVNMVTGAIFFGVEGESSQLDRWPVIESILLNLPVYALWAVFGVGLGTLIRSQLGATVTAAAVYLVAGNLALVAFRIVWLATKWDWILTAAVAIPSVASQVMITPAPAYEQAPPQWVGAVVLVGYGVLTTVIGAALIRRRDIA